MERRSWRCPSCDRQIMAVGWYWLASGRRKAGKCVACWRVSPADPDWIDERPEGAGDGADEYDDSWQPAVAESERVAMRALIARHRAEYAAILSEMETADYRP